MREFRAGQSVAVKGIVRGVNVHPTEGVYVDVETASGDGLMSSIHGVDILDLGDFVSPKKADSVVIPRFIADWLDKCKSESDKHSLSSAIGNDVPSEVSNWLSFDNCRNEEVFARAWLDGYEVEREKVYTVKIPNPHHDGITVLEKVGDEVIMSQMDDYLTDWQKEPEYQLTEAEIRKDFDWAWQAGFAKEVADDL